MNKQFFIVFLSILCGVENIYSQDSLNRNKKIIVNTGVMSVYAGSLIYLNQTWYKPYRTTHFHFFNDNTEWGGMDKIGHGFSAYYVSFYLEKIFKWASFQHTKLYAAGITWLYLLNIELLDGFSTGWGFSLGDLTSNTVGCGLFFLSKDVCKDFFVPKFSYYPDAYPSLNPVLLGNTEVEKIIKNYNAQTYWISISPFYKWKKNMEWLCLSFGYGINGFIGARSNTYVRNEMYYDYSCIPREKQLYLSIDIDLSRIPTKKKWVKKILTAINWLKIPAPAIEWRGNNVYFRPLLFSN